jgi:peptidoglycan/LPS O-acetylase OafA/YrhL
VVVGAIATACATLSYYLVERPLLRFKDPQRPTGSSVLARAEARAAPEVSPSR